MLAKKHHPLIFIANVLIFFFVIFFHTSEVFNIGIKNATPLLLLPLLTAFSFFSGVGTAAVAGFVSGAFMDSVASHTHCFNTVVLMLVGVFVSLAADNLFNKNISAAAVLSLIASAVYYLLMWLFFHGIGNTVRDSLTYLLSYALPSAVYSALFIVPFYFIYRYFDRCRKR